MTLYQINDDEITDVPTTTFESEDIKERKDLQVLLKLRPEVISPDTLIVGEEFSDWEGSQKRIDLLGIDKKANLVVIELKRTADGGYMDLQAIRYSAMISAMTFDMLVEHYGQYLKRNNSEENARDKLVEFLDWEDTDAQELGQNIQIILASADFSKELTTSVLWLNEQGLDIRCVRMRPYKYHGRILLDVQTIIPVPEIEEYQIQIRKKRQSEREQNKSKKDYSKYDLAIDGNLFCNLHKRNLMYKIFSELLQVEEGTEKIENTLPPRKLRVFEGLLEDEEVRELIMLDDKGSQTPKTERYFCKDGESKQVKGKTYVLSNQWGVDTLDFVDKLRKMFPDQNIKINETSTQGI